MLEILDYRPEHQPWFESLNRDWIERHFWMEPVDVAVLQHPEKHILEKGGTILVATTNKEIAGTVALKRVDDHVYEFTKMAVEERFRRQKIGQALALAALQRAKNLGARKVILYSSTKLAPALSLYRKLGFVEVPVDGPYKRSDIKMELMMDPASTITIRKALISDVGTLAEVGADTFIETFGVHNTKEDMDDYVARNFSVQQVQKELQTPGTVFLLAEEDSQVVGYAKVRTHETPEELLEKNALELERIYAVKTHLGKSVGKMLMQYCLDYARNKNYDVVWLGVWENNPRAIAFYEKWGFKKFGTHAFLLGKDLQTDYMMKLEISREG